MEPGGDGYGEDYTGGNGIDGSNEPDSIFSEVGTDDHQPEGHDTSLDAKPVDIPVDFADQDNNNGDVPVSIEPKQAPVSAVETGGMTTEDLKARAMETVEKFQEMFAQLADLKKQLSEKTSRYQELVARNEELEARAHQTEDEKEQIAAEKGRLEAEVMELKAALQSIADSVQIMHQPDVTEASSPEAEAWN